MEYNVSAGSTVGYGEFVSSAAASDGTQISLNKKFCHYSCKCCFNLAKEPVLNVICGHLFCWRCIYLKLTSSSDSHQGCPYCKSHLDISRSMSTIIPLFSGPEPVEFSVHDYPDTDEEEEAEAKHRQTIQKRGDEYVPLRPVWRGRSIYFYSIDVIVNKLLSLYILRSNWKHTMDWIASSADIPSGTKNLDDMIQEWKDGWQWLTGEEYRSQPNDIKSGIKSKKMKVGDHMYDLVPTEAKFPGVSTFACRKCKNIACEPVVTACGHLFCWSCLWNEGDGACGCPECDALVTYYSTRANINNIYCKKSKPSKEDEVLISTRKYFNKEKIPAPCRLDQTVAVPFLRYMITRTREDVDSLMKMLNDMRSNYADLSVEKCKKTISNAQALLDNLYADLTRKWGRDLGEPPLVEDSKKPFFFDCESGVTKEIIHIKW